MQAAVRAFGPSIAYQDGTIQLFYNDEHALALGVKSVSVKTSSGTTTKAFPVSAMNATRHVSTSGTGQNLLQVGCPSWSKQLASWDLSACAGDYAPNDVSGRPMYPSVFITDITDDPNLCQPSDPDTATKCRDWQFGGVGLPPNDVFGAWKGATRLVDKTHNPATVTLTMDADPAKNDWNLGPDADPVPPGLKDEGYGAEARWDVSALGLLPNHAYRVQLMDHDGDQNKAGGDSGEGCMTVVIVPRPTP